ncbi:MAG: thioredoxin family protein [Planctomycetota bacterium]
MCRWMNCLAIAVCLLQTGWANAGEYNQALNIGDAGPAWRNLPGIDGKTHSLVDLAKKDVVVVVFTCNSCPVAVDYEDRIIDFTKKYAGPEDKVAVVAINVNKIEADSLPMMKERAKERGFNFPYLFDETQGIAKAYGATYTPEFFVLGKDRKVVYMGGMDDDSNPEKVKTNYLVPAVEAALAGKKPEIAETLARGCMVRYAKERRKKASN